TAHARPESDAHVVLQCRPVFRIALEGPGRKRSLEECDGRLDVVGADAGSTIDVRTGDAELQLGDHLRAVRRERPGREWWRTGEQGFTYGDTLLDVLVLLPVAETVGEITFGLLSFGWRECACRKHESGQESYPPAHPPALHRVPPSLGTRWHECDS